MKEGTTRKGGRGDLPKTPRPKTRPKGQGTPHFRKAENQGPPLAPEAPEDVPPGWERDAEGALRRPGALLRRVKHVMLYMDKPSYIWQVDLELPSRWEEYKPRHETLEAAIQCAEESLARREGELGATWDQFENTWKIASKFLKDKEASLERAQEVVKQAGEEVQVVRGLTGPGGSLPLAALQTVMAAQLRRISAMLAKG